LTDRIDIADPIREICERLGLQPSDVGRLDITPLECKAEIFLNNAYGSKYIAADGGVAKETRTLEVQMFRVQT
jgi:hypothetical protein